MIAQQDLGDFFDVLSIILRDVLVAKQNENLVLSKHVSDAVVKLGTRFSAHAVAEIIRKINAERQKLSLNVSATSAVDDLLFSILEAKYKWQ